jgi:predicted ester cyclase
MSSTENKSLIHRLYDEAINHQDAVAAAGFYAEDAMNHSRVVGRAGMQKVFAALFSVFPDFHYEILEGLAHDPHPHPPVGPLACFRGSPPEREGGGIALRAMRIDRVVCKVMMTGTHLGEPTMPEIFHGMLKGVAPTGKRVQVLQYHDFLIRGGLIVEHAAVRDDLGMLLQLGVVQKPG